MISAWAPIEDAHHGIYTLKSRNLKSRKTGKSRFLAKTHEEASGTYCKIYGYGNGTASDLARWQDLDNFSS